MNRVKALVLIVGVAIIALSLTDKQVRVHLVRFLTAPYELVVAVETGFKMHIIEAEIWRYYKNHGKFPPEPYIDAFMRGKSNSIAPKSSKPLLTDHWNGYFHYRRLVYPEGYRLVCVGKDGKFGTKDDVIFGWQSTKTIRKSKK